MMQDQIIKPAIFADFKRDVLSLHANNADFSLSFEWA